MLHRLSLGIHELHLRLLEMGELVELSLVRSISAMNERSRPLAEWVLAEERRINRLEMEIDDLAVKLIALHQPVACDLRFITAAMKINTDLERVGDLAVTIARRGIALIEEPDIYSVKDDMRRLAGATLSMLSRSLTAFLHRDPDLAQQILRDDDAVDSLRDKIALDLAMAMQEDRKCISTGIDLMFIARSLERVADHATNIAEDVVFLVRGDDVRHRRSVA